MTTPVPDSGARLAPQTHPHLAAEIAATLAAIRERRPRVHSLTNPVAHQLTANGLLALGAIPTLTANIREVGAFIRSADAVLLNLGMLDQERFESLPHAAEIAGTLGKPFVLDPAFADRSPERIALAETLLKRRPTIVKPNLREAEILSQVIPAGSVEVITGARDSVCLGLRQARLANGHALMERVTATGCLLGAILAACLAVEPDPFRAAVAGVSILNIAAEIAAEGAGGPGSFAYRLLDALAALDADAIHRSLNVEMLRDDA